MKAKYIITALLTVLTTISAWAQGDALVITMKDGRQFTIADNNLRHTEFFMETRFDQIGGNGDTWFIVGGDIGDGTWSNNTNAVGSSMMPLYPVDDKLVWEGYLEGNGFKLVHKPGYWEEQWGMSSWGDFIRDYGDNIVVPEPGYYRVEVFNGGYGINIYRTVEPVMYDGISVAGSMTEWMDQELIPAKRTNNHDWYSYVFFNDGDEMKFKQTGTWDVNWGADIPQTGIGYQNGPNIPCEQGLYMVCFNDILGGYYFYNDNYSSPGHMETHYYDFPMDVTPLADTFNLENVSDRIKLFDFNTLFSETNNFSFSTEMKMTVNGQVRNFYIDNNNEISTYELMAFLAECANQKVMEAECTVTKTFYINNNYMRCSGSVDVKFIVPDEYVKYDHYYLPNGSNGWNLADAPMIAKGLWDDYAYGYCYLSDAFTITTDRNWDSRRFYFDDILNFYGMPLANDNGNFAIEKPGYYYVSFDDYKNLDVQPIESVGIIGDFNGWADDIEMTYDAEADVWVVDVNFATDTYFKFRFNHAWDLNLGISYNDRDALAQNGENIYISAGRHRITLSLSRRWSNKMTCKVE